MPFVVALADAELNVVAVAVELVAEEPETVVVVYDVVAATDAVVAMAATEAAAAVVVADAELIDAAKAAALSARVEPQAAVVDSTAPRSAGSWLPYLRLV